MPEHGILMCRSWPNRPSRMDRFRLLQLPASNRLTWRITAEAGAPTELTLFVDDKCHGRGAQKCRRRLRSIGQVLNIVLLGVVAKRSIGDAQEFCRFGAHTP